MSQNMMANPFCDLTRVEDYLEVIYDLIETKGYARGADIAARLDVKASSVTGMIQKLDAVGLVVYERYRGLTLTDKGEKMAKYTQRKHALILKFLRLLGIEEKTANEDAEGLEHHVHKATVNRIERFVDFANDHPSWFKTFSNS